MKIHRKWTWTILTILVMGLIWWFSGADGAHSGMQSGFFSHLLFWMEPDQASFLVRKTAHFTIYLVLGLCVNETLRLWGLEHRNRLLLSLLICFLYACSDEWHQTFVPGRAGQFRDVLLDTAGSLTGLLTWMWMSRGRKEQKEQR